MPWRSTPPDWDLLDQAESRNGEPPSARIWRSGASAVNHVMARNHRVIFNQHAILADLPGATTNPLYVFRYNDDFGHGRRLDYRVLSALLPLPIGANPRMDTDTGEERRMVEAATAPTEAPDTRLQRLATYHVVANAYANKDIAVFDGYRPVALAVIQRPRVIGSLSTADADLTNPARFASGEKIEDEHLADIDKAFDHSWMRQRKVVAAWASLGLADPASRSLTNDAVFMNLIDRTAHAWTTTSAGLICPVENEGRGGQTADEPGRFVQAQCAVYAQGTAAGQTVRFESGAAAPGNVVNITVGVAKDWYPAATRLDLRTPGPSAPGVEKVDVGFATTAAQTIRVWAGCVQIDPA